MHVLRFGNKLNEEVCRGFIFANLFNSLYLYVRLGWSILIANLVTNSQDLVAIVKYLVALAPASGTISRPVFGSNINVHVILLFHPRDPPDHLAHQENRFDAIYSIYCSSCCTYQPLPTLTCFRPLGISEDASCVPRIRNSPRPPKLNYNCSYIWCKKNQIILSQPAGAFFLPIYLKVQETKGIFKWQFLPMLLKFQSFSPATAIFWTSLSGTITLHDHTTRSHFTISWLTSIWFSFMQGLPGKIPLGWVRNNDVILFFIFYFLSLFTFNIFWLLLDALTSDPTK